MKENKKPRPSLTAHKRALAFMTLTVLAASLIILAGSPVPQVVRAQQALSPPQKTVTQTLSYSTGSVQIWPFPAAYVSITYTIQATLSGPSAVLPGSSYTYNLSLSDPEATVSVSLLGQNYTVTVPLPLGQQVSVPVTDFISVDLATSATAFVYVSGEASANPQTLQFPSTGTETFTVDVSPGLPGNGNVQVNVTVRLNLEITGGSIATFNAQIRPVNFGLVTLQPTLQLTARRGYIVTFIEKGLPNGTEWQVTVGGNTQASTSNEIALVLPYGTYSFAAEASSPNYAAVNGTGNINVAGNEVVYISFNPVHKQAISMGSASSSIRPLANSYVVAAVIAVVAITVGNVIIKKRR